MRPIYFIAAFMWNSCFGQVNDLTSGTSAIHWCEGRKLLWSDFNKVEDVGQEMKARSDVSIPIEIAISSTKGLTYTVSAVFETTSWTATDDEYCLQHEQLHFDIGELYARKIRRLLNLNRKSSKAQILGLVNEMIHSFNETQSQFDIDTSHGIYLERQQRWRDSVDLELDKLSFFSYRNSCP